jgi:hypothetical protein
MRVDFGLRLPLAGYNTREKESLFTFSPCRWWKGIIGDYDLATPVAWGHWLNISSAARVSHNKWLIGAARPDQI